MDVSSSALTPISISVEMCFQLSLTQTFVPSKNQEDGSVKLLLASPAEGLKLLESKTENAVALNKVVPLARYAKMETASQSLSLQCYPLLVTAELCPANQDGSVCMENVFLQLENVLRILTVRVGKSA